MPIDLDYLRGPNRRRLPPRVFSASDEEIFIRAFRGSGHRVLGWWFSLRCQPSSFPNRHRPNAPRNSLRSDSRPEWSFSLLWRVGRQTFFACPCVNMRESRVALVFSVILGNPSSGRPRRRSLPRVRQWVAFAVQECSRFNECWLVRLAISLAVSTLAVLCVLHLS